MWFNTLFSSSKELARRRQADWWAVRLSDADVEDDDLAKFARWLEESQANRSAYEASARILAQSSGARAEKPAGIIQEKSLWPKRITRWSIAGGLAICLVFGILFVSLNQFSLFPDETHVTDLGEQQLVALPDNSKIYLNTSSKLEVEYTDTIRFATLPAGEAFFDIASDAERPFVVQTEHSTIQVIGTKFNVRTENGRDTVSVLEGSVQVKLQRRSETEEQVIKHLLSAGEEVVYEPQGANVVRDYSDVEKLSAWRFGRVEFDAVPLWEAVAEINRYRKKPIVVKDPELAGLPITGSFSIEGTEGFIAALRSINYIEVVNANGELALLKVERENQRNRPN